MPEEKWIANWVMLAKRYKATIPWSPSTGNESHGTLAERRASGHRRGRRGPRRPQKYGNAVLAEVPTS